MMMNLRSTAGVLAVVSMVCVIAGLFALACASHRESGGLKSLPPERNPRYQTGEMIRVPAGHLWQGERRAPFASSVIHEFSIGQSPVTIAEYTEFIAAGGYANQAYWNPVGWDWRTANKITLPAYWNSNEKGLLPVRGVSWWEADAYCRWAGGRLPTKAEWAKWSAYVVASRISGVQGVSSNLGGSILFGVHHHYDVDRNLWEWINTKSACDLGTEFDLYHSDDGRDDPPVSWDDCCRMLRSRDPRPLLPSRPGLAMDMPRADWSNSVPYARLRHYGFRCARD